MKNLLVIFFVVFVTDIVGQTIIVNPDGTQTMITDNDSIKTVVPEISDFKKHEVRLNTCQFIGGVINLSYEYFLNDFSSIGIVGSYTVFEPLWEPKDVAFVLGTFRLYGGKPTSGFFLEGNLGMISRQTTSANVGYNIATEFGVGGALGCKFVAKKGVVLEVFSGLSRCITDNTAGNPTIFTSSPYTVLYAWSPSPSTLLSFVGISVGKRF